MKCFVAGTLVLTVNGLVAIEAIKQGDIVYAANADTLKVSPRRVLETFVRETSHLVHLTVNGETIVSTFDHPYYVKGKGFVNACDLWIGAELADRNGDTVPVENLYREKLDNKTTTVFNFKVEDYHTYFVGENGILVHNADYDIDLVTNNIQGKVSNDEINPPTKRGNAPISKKGGHPIEVHHNGQNPNGPFFEKTRTDHRLGENYKLNHPNGTQKSSINRAQFKYQVRKYWEHEWDSGRWRLK